METSKLADNIWVLAPPSSSNPTTDILSTATGTPKKEGGLQCQRRRWQLRRTTSMKAQTKRAAPASIQIDASILTVRVATLLP